MGQTEFLDKTPKAEPTKREMDKWDFLKIANLGKDGIKRMKEKILIGRL